MCIMRCAKHLMSVGNDGSQNCSAVVQEDISAAAVQRHIMDARNNRSHDCLTDMQEDVSAAAVARMVDMSLEEVADLLGGHSANSSGDIDTAIMAKQTAQVVLQLEAAMSSGQFSLAVDPCHACRAVACVCFCLIHSCESLHIIMI